MIKFYCSHRPGNDNQGRLPISGRRIQRSERSDFDLVSETSHDISEKGMRDCPVRSRAATVELSIVIPAYNEEDNVAPLYDALRAVLSELDRTAEIIFVDDGSTDRTFERLAALADQDARVRVVKLRRNCGQTPAMVAGIDHARGEVLVTMDADGQNDPADIKLLLTTLEEEEGYDLVVGWRQSRQDKWLSRKLPSLIANRLIAKVTGVEVKDNGCTLKAFRASLIKTTPLYAEMHRFIPAMASLSGCRLAEVKVRHHPRRFGQSKYGLTRIYKVCLDLMVIKTLLVFARRPLLCFLGSASIAAALSLVSFGAALLYATEPGGATAVVFTGISMLLGSLAIFLGLLGLIVSLVHHHHVASPGPAAPLAWTLPIAAGGARDQAGAIK